MSKKIRDNVFPEIEIRSAEQAFEWLRKKMSLDDFLKEDIF
jgi:phage host-nuclease inhibitor protein Gam